jgi:hydroxyethylthiazole kinase-like uncharacterized protein yjeF
MHPLALSCVLCLVRGAGPGNNGGDGLVAARHLAHFGARPTLYYPKAPSKPVYAGLLTQHARLSTPRVTEVAAATLAQDYDIIVDAVFGFSFVSEGGAVRPPFDSLLRTLRASPVPVVALDIPSGWDVEQGDVHHIGVRPAALVSLTAPKLCARFLDRGRTRHLLAGRFVPPYVRVWAARGRVTHRAPRAYTESWTARTSSTCRHSPVTHNLSTSATCPCQPPCKVVSVHCVRPAHVPPSPLARRAIHRMCQVTTWPFRFRQALAGRGGRRPPVHSVRPAVSVSVSVSPLSRSLLLSLLLLVRPPWQAQHQAAQNCPSKSLSSEKVRAS